jgi:two-component system sensor histidine kinase PhoQ
MLNKISQSLSGRLLFSALLFLALFLGLTVYVLDKAFQNSVESALLERLKTHNYSLLAAADDDNGELKMPSLLQDPGFNQLSSGLYGFIFDAEGKEIWRSPSAISLNFQFIPGISSGEFQLSKISTAENDQLYVFTYGITWENEGGKETRYDFSVLQSSAPVEAEIHGFRSTLWRLLGGIGIVLLIILGAIMHWGLSPLRKLATDLLAIEEGRKEELAGNYPLELRGVTRNLNLLIKNERRQQLRYQNTLADLAHSLKTPLAILRGSTTSQKHDNILLEEQIDRMDEIITYQLQRTTTQQVSFTAKGIPLSKVVEKILRSLSKVYADKPVTTKTSIPDQCLFFGDERDLMEILGNLLDNAFKACTKKVAVSAGLTTSTDTNSESSVLSIRIEDDGPGIPHEKRNAVLERGIRADTKTSGQGLGLAVSMEIINSYKGNLNIDTSPLGGAQLVITFPQ